ncbi:NnrS family protein [Pseudoalteromonas phenolica]|uniref:NnrS family protein n=1 Tax=Pseudoalteromonas phenolica TaxID=161398 RepID=A0A5R9PWE5_9GAMM|nr:NnrS family protein [Pseudoalteromonas phenolica]TLX45238.1 NnrS family protein [Pseudoalteromonas phenolica]
MRPINLTEPVPSEFKLFKPHQWPLFMLGFRPFFLLAGFWSVLAILLWQFILNGTLSWQAQIPATLWHAHEMIFGFASAVAIGFLLTAAQTWTGVPGLSGKGLFTLATIWVSCRVIFFFYADNQLLLLLGQIFFWLFAIAYLSHMLVSSASKHNYIMIVVLALLTLFNSAFLMSTWLGEYSFARLFTQLAVLGFMLLIGIIGGRVIPFFTARGLNRDEQVKTPKLDKLLLLFSLLAMTGFASIKLFSLDINVGFVLLPAATLHLTRTILWFDKEIFKVPLLWSLHLGYFLSAVGILFLAFSYLTGQINPADALHLITIGGIGLMILAMMARVSLGHTGRALKPANMLALAFAFIALSALVRSFMPIVYSPHLAWNISAYLWVVGFAIFLWFYTPILIKKRVDGRRG